MRQFIYISMLCLLFLSRKGFGMAPKAPPEFPVVSEYVKACEFNSDEACFWYSVHKSSICSPEKPCSGLVLYFPDQGQSCRHAYRMYFEGGESQNLNDHLLEYASDGFVAVCASLWERPESFTTQSHSSESHRMDKLVESITGSSEINSVWDGSHLFYSGHGIGASSILTVMANSDYDRKRSWHGDRISGACLHDGSFDVIALEKFLHAHSAENAGACDVYRNIHICSRYYGQKKCNHPLPYAGDVVRDTLLDTVQGTLNFRLAGLSVRKWKLIECGSEIEQTPCGQYLEGDVAPKAPIQKLCSKIEQSSGHQCVLQSLPKTPHSTCAYSSAGYAACRDWFHSFVTQKKSRR